MRHCPHARSERIWTDHGNILISTLSDDPLAIAHCNQAIPTQTCWHHHLLEKSRSWNTTWQTNSHWNNWQYLAEDWETAQTGIKHYVAESDYVDKFLHAFHIHNPCKLAQFAWRYYVWMHFTWWTDSMCLRIAIVKLNPTGHHSST